MCRACEGSGPGSGPGPGPDSGPGSGSGPGAGSGSGSVRGVAPVREVAEALLPHLERDAVEHVLLLLVLQLVRRALGLLLLLHLAVERTPQRLLDKELLLRVRLYPHGQRGGGAARVVVSPHLELRLSGGFGGWVGLCAPCADPCILDDAACPCELLPLSPTSNPNQV